MSKVAYLSIACDTDPDVNPSYRVVPPKKDPESIWQGITAGIHTFRRCLQETSYSSKHGHLPVTWLLRSDRQISELYGDAGFCFKWFEKIWSDELKNGSEIGWHPHLYFWDQHTCEWASYLDRDDDLDILTECLHALRQCADINAVRTGWDYHSNKLMTFFDQEGLLVDASAIPGSVQTGDWSHDWSGAPRTPYFPSKLDYRVSAESRKHRLGILEMPVLVRTLSLPLQLTRYGLRNLRRLRSSQANFASWESAQWQGMIITKACKSFYQAVRQILALSSERERIFLTTYFHTDELLSTELVENFVQNLENLCCLTEQTGFTLVPTTLSAAASAAKENGCIFDEHSIQNAIQQ